ncbi:hypothetical protein EV182_000515 [Spiromyces aspiralis]|uniref:Uncharacterized protein n=1 Tax=Spiromyces aspiralis TaxID=68401 RepID=A0ACC1HVX1_9FUNG|nr:hypothetical protein EV182_000515 [Spiromyces aspiralis]
MDGTGCLVWIKRTLQSLTCTFSATYRADIGDGELVQCGRMGCECHIVGDPAHTLLWPLVAIVGIMTLAFIVLSGKCQPMCRCFADKYVEFDVTIQFIDMFLHKLQIYRHLLINQPKFEHSTIKVRGCWRW